MEAAGYGRVVFNSSVAGLTGGVVGPHYASSKAAVHGLVHWLAGNLAAKGVTVNAVAPALIEATGMLPGGGGEALMKSEWKYSLSLLCWCLLDVSGTDVFWQRFRLGGLGFQKRLLVRCFGWSVMRMSRIRSLRLTEAW